MSFCGVDWDVDEEELAGCVDCGYFGGVGAEVEVVGGFFGEGGEGWAAQREDDEVVDGRGDWALLYGSHFGGLCLVGVVAKRIGYILRT